MGKVYIPRRTDIFISELKDRQYGPRPLCGSCIGFRSSDLRTKSITTLCNLMAEELPLLVGSTHVLFRGARR